MRSLKEKVVFKMFRKQPELKANLSPGDSASGGVWVHFWAHVKREKNNERPYLPELLSICIDRERKLKQEIVDLKASTWCLADRLPKRDNAKFESPFCPIDPLTHLVTGCERRMIGEAFRQIHGWPETATFYCGPDGNPCAPGSLGAIPVEESVRFDSSIMPHLGRFTTADLRQKLDEMADDLSCVDATIELGKVRHIAVFVRHTLEEECPIVSIPQNPTTQKPAP